MINVITTFSGYDSQCLALRKAGIDFDLVAWAEFDPQSKQPLEKQPAVIAHNLLFPEYKERNLGDMAKVDWTRFKGIEIDLFTYSFRCTDISQAGLMKAARDCSVIPHSISSRVILLWKIASVRFIRPYGDRKKQAVISLANNCCCSKNLTSITIKLINIFKDGT